MCRSGIVLCVVFSACLANFVNCSPAAPWEQEVQISPSTEDPARGFNFWNALLNNSGMKKTVKPVIVYQKPAAQESVVYVPYPYPYPTMVPAKGDKAEEKEAGEKKKKEAEEKKKKEAEEKKKKEAEEKKKKEAEERIRKLTDQLRESQERQRDLLEKLIKEYRP